MEQPKGKMLVGRKPIHVVRVIERVLRNDLALCDVVSDSNFSRLAQDITAALVRKGYVVQ